MYDWLVPRVIFPVYERLSGRRLWTEVLRLRKLQWRPPEELEARAIQKLRPLLLHAAAHVPYYRDLFKQAGFHPEDLRTVADLSRIPITTKAGLRPASRLGALPRTSPRADAGGREPPDLLASCSSFTRTGKAWTTGWPLTCSFWNGRAPRCGTRGS